MRVLFIAETVTLSHFVRPYVLAGALHAAGYAVTLAADPRYDALFVPPAFRRVRITSSIPRDGLAERRASLAPLFDIATLERYVREDRRLINLFRPDLVVGDMRQSLAVSCAQAGVPFLNIIDATFSPYRQAPFELVHYPIAGLIGRDAARGLLDPLMPLGFLLHGLPNNLSRLRHGVPGWLPDPRAIYAAGDFVVYSDIPQIVPLADLPPSHRFIGPTAWSPTVAMPDWWHALPADRPIVYLNLSASTPGRFLETALAAVSGLPVTVIALADPAQAGAARRGANIHCAPVLPGAAVAARAVLVVCNGSPTAVQQSLAEGTPVLALAAYPEQAMYGAALREAGAGELLLAPEVTVAALRDTVSAMLRTESHATAAAALRKSLAEYDSRRLFPAFVADIVSGAVTTAQ